MVAHEKIKPEKWAQVAAALTERELVVPLLFTKKGVGDFKGARDDTLNMRVPGVLPAHSYGWRNDRAQEMIVDAYKERKVAVTFGGDAYSATELTDEQYEFDFDNWSETLLPAQAKAVARKLEYEAVDKLVGANYSVEVGAKPENLVNDIVEARRALNLMGAPKTGRTLLVGSDWDTYLQTMDEVNHANMAGDVAAQSAFQDALIGKIKGFNIVVSDELPSDEAYALTDSAFVFLNAAPHVPDSVVGGTAVSERGIAMRWLKDYETLRSRERSVMNTWYGINQVKDPAVYWDKTNTTEVVSESEYNLRAVKLKLGGTDAYFTKASNTGDAAKVKKALGLEKRSAATTYKAPSTAGH
ncbi:hypothetical protein [Schaalia sp. ZJ1691]|uniref:hypothetical protein n=1 Tax=Schaalia sp. ZJ1691 TaxID=2709404 RepID=UPI0013EDB8AC|nr:hypothetical protein [Schaalia sp. ZJ1691]